MVFLRVAVLDRFYCLMNGPALYLYFRESEDFELLCQSQLDSYIEGAKSLETTLNRQKDVLFGRLQGLGKTLQL